MERLIFHRLTSGSASNTFGEDVRVGLSSAPKALQPKYFYDKLGSSLFEAITCLPEYYLTRDEREILEKNSAEIIDAVNAGSHSEVELIELGSGNSEKTRRLIEPLLKLGPDLHYIPIDISDTSLERSGEDLLRFYPQLRVTAYVSDYQTALNALRTVNDGGNQNRPRRIVMFLGSSIGNLNFEESTELLLAVRAMLAPGDCLLLGADLQKSLDVLLPAYDDALKITAAFNLNLLVRINRELGGNFKIEQFQHRAIYNQEHDRIEMHLISLVQQSVRIEALDLEVQFAEGESIHTENSYKFDTAKLADLAAKTGFSLGKTWYDSNRRFSFNFFQAT